MWRERESSYNITCSANNSRNSKWIKVRIKDICKITKGKNPCTLNEDGIGRPIVAAQNIEDISGNASYLKYTEEALPECKPDDILLLWDGSRAGICGYNHTAILSSTIMKLTILDKQKIDPKLIYYMLKMYKDTINGGKTGSAIPHLSRQVVENITFEIPESLEDQHHIVQLLSEYDSLIDTQTNLISVVTRESSYNTACSQVVNHSSNWRKLKLNKIFKIHLICVLIYKRLPIITIMNLLKHI